MVPDRKLVAVVTAMMLVAPPARSQDQYSLSELLTLDGLIGAQDCGGLWSHLQGNPALMAGNDPLARELRTFAESVQRGALNCFAAGSRTASVVRDLSSAY